MKTLTQSISETLDIWFDVEGEENQSMTREIIALVVGEFEEILQHDPSVTRRLLEEKIAEIRQGQEELL
jgi:hypothetical protein